MSNSWADIYVPTRTECNDAKAQAREQLIAAGIDQSRWNLDGMGCGHGSHIEDC